VRLAVVADAEEMRLVGSAGDPREADAVVTLGASSRPPGARLWVDWPAGERHAAPGSDRPDLVIAPHGNGLWRREVWPVSEELFSLPPAPADAVALVLGDPGDERDEWERAIGNHARTAVTDRLSVAELERASVVVAPGGRLPGAAFAALAAGRLLVTGRLGTSFGLLAQVDHVEVAGALAAAQVVAAARERPSAFSHVIASGALAAERRRAPLVYSRLGTDLGVERNSRSAVSS
jgi:hypothetical protein